LEHILARRCGDVKTRPQPVCGKQRANGRLEEAGPARRAAAAGGAEDAGRPRGRTRVDDRVRGEIRARAVADDRWGDAATTAAAASLPSAGAGPAPRSRSG